MPTSIELATIENSITAGDKRVAAKLLTRIERCDPSVIPILKSLYLKGGKTHVLGITGPPGAGKSTLINRLIAEYRRRGQTVAVLAVDPSSPYTGGSILGDRVRMNQHTTDSGVFIRSMASRGHMGGLAKAAADAITVLDAMTFDVVIAETVGVGQSEVDIVRHANTVLVVQPPHFGDRIQSVKSGVMEIADIFAINKSDLPGVNKAVQAIKEMVRLHYQGTQWMPPVVETQATTGAGTQRLLENIEAHRRLLKNSPDLGCDSMVEKVKLRVSGICEQMLRQEVMDQRHWSENFRSQIEDICCRRLDPYTLAETLVATRDRA